MRTTVFHDLSEDTSNILLETSCCIHLISKRLEAAQYMIAYIEALFGLNICVITF